MSGLRRMILAAALAGAWSGAWAARGQEAEPPAGMLSVGGEGERPGYFDRGGEARGETVAAERGIAFDIEEVRTAQEEALTEQAKGQEEALVGAKETGFWGWMDKAHDRAFRLMDNLVRTLDLSWTQKGDAYESDVSRFLFGVLVRGGGRSNDGDFDAKVKFRVDAALPGLERRFHLILDNAGRDYLPGSDPMERENDLRLGLTSGWKTWLGCDFDAGGGLRLRSGKPVGFVEGSLKWTWERDWGTVWFRPRVTWYTDDGIGEDAETGWRRYFGAEKRWGLAVVGAEKWTEGSDAVLLEGTVRGAWMHGEKRTRGWLAWASVFPQIDDKGEYDCFVDNWVVGVTWKDALYRRWIYYAITPRLDFGREDDYEAHGSIRVGLDILFGGEAGPLM